MPRLLWWVVATAAVGGFAQHWRPLRPANVRQTGAFRAPPLMESSGAVRSRAHPGRFWSINDSENPATLFLADTTGRVAGFVRVPGVADTDWEAVSAGPCGQIWCVFIGDIGDNREIRRTVTIFRLPEPTPGQLQAMAVPPPESLVIRYPDGPRDAEALVVTGSGGLGIVTKGRNRPPRVYWVGPDAWRKGVVIAEFLAELPIATSLLLGHLVTDAALSPDDAVMAVRTYKNIFFFRRAAGARLPTQPDGVCPIAGLDPQGEGLAWWAPRTWLMTSEVTRFGPGAITLLECRGPEPSPSGG